MRKAILECCMPHSFDKKNDRVFLSKISQKSRSVIQTDLDFWDVFEEKMIYKIFCIVMIILGGTGLQIRVRN